MLYSVYNYGTKAYDYYAAPTKPTPHAPKPPDASGSSSLGASPDQAAWPLPSGAKLVGRGQNPKGRIAIDRSGMGGALGGVLDDTSNLLAVGGVAFLVWRFFLKKG